MHWYLIIQIKALQFYHQQVKEAYIQEEEKESSRTDAKDVKPGDYILIKNFNKKKLQFPSSVQQVLLTETWLQDDKDSILNIEGIRGIQIHWEARKTCRKKSESK
ncbi:hypothetical protein chiPu_0018330 [Chiloscyllium punctatum]|uniref:Uncharacterized protein n=1 Tax=Chiloscyllium punctatum TaxID=137246 RepID=A0A401RMH7_CHIPU|nr:hypothetical protein [Chiloscyllium punctatum]